MVRRSSPTKPGTACSGGHEDLPGHGEDLNRGARRGMRQISGAYFASLDSHNSVTALATPVLAGAPHRLAGTSAAHRAVEHFT